MCCRTGQRHTGGLPAPVAGLNFLALSHDEVRGTAPASYLGQDLGGEQFQMIEVVQVEDLEVGPRSPGGRELAKLVHDLGG